MKKIIAIFLIFCLCLAIPSAMAVEEENGTINNTNKHGESGEVNPVNLAKLLSDDVISEDDYNRMIGTVVENEQIKQEQEAENETIYQTVTEAATPEPTTTAATTEEEIIEEILQVETVTQEGTTEAATSEEVFETLTEIQEIPKTTDTNESETVQVEKSLIDQIIAVLQGLIGV